MDDETGLKRLSGMTKVTQLFTLRTRTETRSSVSAAVAIMLKVTVVDE